MVSMLTNVQFGNWPLINLLHFPDSLILEESETFFNFKATNWRFFIKNLMINTMFLILILFKMASSCLKKVNTMKQV